MAPRFHPDDTVPFKGGANEVVPGSVDRYLYFRAATIFGGSNEIQRGLIWNTLFRG
jgi:hypothetical protein